MGVELPLCVVVTILECCVTFSGVKLSIRSFVLLLLLLNEILPRLNKAKGILLDSFLCGSLLSHLLMVSAEFSVSGFITDIGLGACLYEA